MVGGMEIPLKTLKSMDFFLPTMLKLDQSLHLHQNNKINYLNLNKKPIIHIKMVQLIGFQIS
jgi:hypothetical protein